MINDNARFQRGQFPANLMPYDTSTAPSRSTASSAALTDPTGMVDGSNVRSGGHRQFVGGLNEALHIL
jgi:hypothetical protein